MEADQLAGNGPASAQSTASGSDNEKVVRTSWRFWRSRATRLSHSALVSPVRRSVELGSGQLLKWVFPARVCAKLLAAGEVALSISFLANSCSQRPVATFRAYQR